VILAPDGIVGTFRKVGERLGLVSAREGEQ